MSENVDKTIDKLCSWIQTELEKTNSLNQSMVLPETVKALAELIAARNNKREKRKTERLLKEIFLEFSDIKKELISIRKILELSNGVAVEKISCQIRGRLQEAASKIKNSF